MNSNLGPSGMLAVGNRNPMTKILQMRIKSEGKVWEFFFFFGGGKGSRGSLDGKIDRVGDTTSESRGINGCNWN